MSADGSIPSQWDESAYTPFPPFKDWVPADYDSGLVDRYEQQLRALRAKVSDTDLERALRVVNRYAAIDTGAIEGLYQVDRGFTKTVATQSAAWENALSLKGEGVKRAIEDALGAYDYVLDAMTGAVGITEVWIRELHEIICASQESFAVHTPVGLQEHSLPKGVYKTMPNSPTNASTGRVHAYAPPAQTPSEMNRLIAELRSPEFQASHPVLQASYAHYAYVAIHPFSDGNGRVARALASVYLYRSPGVPLVVFADQRDRYLDALEAADGGDSSQFIRFVETRTVDAVSLLEASLRTDSWDVDEDISDLRAIFGDQEASEIALQTADKIRGLAMGAFDAALAAAKLPDTLEVRVTSSVIGRQQVQQGWNAIGACGRFTARIKSEWPFSLLVMRNFDVVMRAHGFGAEYAVMAEKEAAGVEIWRRDVEPTVTESVQLRLELWAQHEVRALLHETRQKARAASGS
ncbi:Fic family protein [Curtobacterium flaccumfaciens]|uniref:Fic family protein n=1 Tax=Curtobacterium flaccumfaciens TaxID=2035 RepID=UPI00188C0A69|nr:Fic family protein [Curtobacterium flaccumfaciens]MBF4627257.1 Fic family protein [Curtobacterium flaccumfaciens]